MRETPLEDFGGTAGDSGLGKARGDSFNSSWALVRKMKFLAYRHIAQILEFVLAPA